MNLKKLVKSKTAWLIAGVLAMVLAAATLAQAAPTIGSGATPPSSHSDGRSSQSCTDCHAVRSAPVVDPVTNPAPVAVPAPGDDAEDANDDADESQEAHEANEAGDSQDRDERDSARAEERDGEHRADKARKADDGETVHNESVKADRVETVENTRDGAYRGDRADKQNSDDSERDSD